MKKTRIKKKFIILIMIICIITLIISSYRIIKWSIYSKNTIKEAEKLQDIVNIEESNNESEIIDQVVEIPKNDPYWDFIETPLINVNFDELKNINNDTYGWIQVMGTIINYPFVKTNDNSYYLNHSFNKKYNEAGWIFMDYRNNENDKNIILYGHGRLDNTMFGSLKNILTNKWISNTNNYIIKLSTEDKNTLWQIFSVYHTPLTSDYLKINFNSDEDYINFINMIKDRSLYNFDTTLNENDRILTLSTCYNISDRVVLHAKLIKQEAK